MSAPTERQVLDWLALLGRLVASNMTADEAGQRLRAYAPLLIANFDSDTINAASREYVARRCKFFPSYGELCDHLAEWRKENPPQPVGLMLAGPSDPQMAPEDWQWVSFWHRRRAEIFAQGYGPKRGSVEADRANLASLVRAQSPRAWAHISGEPLPVRAAPTEAEKAAVARLVRAVAPDAVPEPNPRPRPAPMPHDVLAAVRTARGVVSA